MDAPSTCRPMPTSRSPSLSRASSTAAGTQTSSAGSSRRARRDQKPGRSMRPLGDPLAHQQGGDEEAGDDEEDVDAEEPAGQPGRVEVEDEHRHDGQGAQPVEAGQPPGAAGGAGRRQPVADLGVAPGRGRCGSAASLHHAHVVTVGAGGDSVTEARSWGDGDVRRSVIRPVRRSLPSARGWGRWGRRRAADDGVRARAGAGGGLPMVDPGPGARAGPGGARPQHRRRPGRGGRRGLAAGRRCACSTCSPSSPRPPAGPGGSSRCRRRSGARAAAAPASPSAEQLSRPMRKLHLRTPSEGVRR